jgi:hypothetical protein
MTRGGTRGTIDFRHDVTADVVIMRPRWLLDSTLEVTRWYHLASGYFSQRFREKKDVISVHDGFDVTAQVAALWGQYRARLHEAHIGLSVRVGNNARVRLATQTSSVRYSVSALECPTVEEAIKVILQTREAAARPPSGLRRRSSSVPPAPSARPPRSSEG